MTKVRTTRTAVALTTTLAALVLGACGSSHGVVTRTVTVPSEAAAGGSQTKVPPAPGVPARTEPNLIAEAEAKAVLHGKSNARLHQLARALTSYASCMRANGVAYPRPHATPNGRVLDTRGLDTTTAQYKAANSKCTAQRLAKYGG
jgi:hypothetical protein